MAEAPTIQTYNPGILQTNAQIPNVPVVDPETSPQPQEPAQIQAPVSNVVTQIK